MRAATICQGRSHSSAFVWLDLSSLHNSIQSGSCWQELSGSSQRNTPPPPTHSLQLLWMEKRWRTAQDRRGRKWTANEKAKDLMVVYSTRHLPHVHGWTCATAIRTARAGELETFLYSTSPSVTLTSSVHVCIHSISSSLYGNAHNKLCFFDYLLIHCGTYFD